MRLGLIGPSEDNPLLLREAAEFLLCQVGVDMALYLGAENTRSHVANTWAEQIMDGPATRERFLDQAATLALGADSHALDTLLGRDREHARLAALRGLPVPAGRIVELVDDKVILVVHDKSSLDQEDIANSFLIIYGHSSQAALHRFGPRAFFTPGPLSQGRISIVERAPDGQLAIAHFDPRTSEPLGRDLLTARRSRVVVTP